MSAVTLRTIAGTARTTALDCAWTQWSALTHTASGSTGAATRFVVDPEALVLISLTLWDDERRLRDLLFSFARQESKLLSVHRMQVLCDSFPERTRDRLAEFASWAKHPSWLRLGKLATTRESAPPRDKPLGPLRLHNPPALHLRLRTAFGVGLKSDLLTCLLCRQDAPSTLSQLSLFVGYSERNTRAAADDLAAAGFVVRDDYSPHQTYRAAGGDWSGFLSMGREQHSEPAVSIPHWQSWATVYAFLAAVADTEIQSASNTWSEYVTTSRVRDLIEQYYPRLIRAEAAQWSGSMPGKLPAMTELDALVTTVRTTVADGLE